MAHPKQIALETSLRALCDALDIYLEDMFGSRYPLHPNRLPRGKAASVAYDGLFSTGTQFTMGYGSQRGRGYIVSIDIVTLARVAKKDRQEIEDAAAKHINYLLPLFFPDRDLSVVQDGTLYKIVGNFSLGAV